MKSCAQLSDVARLSVEPGRRAGAVRAGGAAGGPGPRHRGSRRGYHPGSQVQLKIRFRIRMGFTRIRPSRNTGSRSDLREKPVPTLDQ